jgi:hypothetical protein
MSTCDVENGPTRPFSAPRLPSRRRCSRTRIGRFGRNLDAEPSALTVRVEPGDPGRACKARRRRRESSAPWRPHCDAILGPGGECASAPASVRCAEPKLGARPRKGAEAARSNRAGRMAYSSRFSEPEMPKSTPFVPRTLPPCQPEKPTSRAEREREAKAYRDSLTEA